MKIKYKRGQRRYEVIIATCYMGSSTLDIINGKIVWRISSATPEDLRQTFPSKKLALQYANPQKGKAVTLRPKFNEKNCNGEFFREWRSFDGEVLKEVKWNI